MPTQLRTPAGVGVVARLETGFHFAEIHRVFDDLQSPKRIEERTELHISANWNPCARHSSPGTATSRHRLPKHSGFVASPVRTLATAHDTWDPKELLERFILQQLVDNAFALGHVLPHW